MSCFILIGEVASYTTTGSKYSIGVFDFFVNAYRGGTPYIGGSGAPFQIPVIWLTLQFFSQYLISTYPIKDLNGFGQNILMKAGNKGLWWSSKFLWTIEITILFYIIAVAIMTIITIIYNGQFILFGTSLKIIFPLQGITNEELHLFYAMSIVGPILSSMALGAITLTISIMFSPAYAMILCLVLLISTAFWQMRLFFTEYSMALRNPIVFIRDNNFGYGIVCAVITLIVMFISGLYIINKVDFLSWRTKQ